MSTKISNRTYLRVLNLAPVFIFLALVLIFSLMSDRFFSFQNMANIFSNSANVSIMAIGMTFVLLIAGIDLSVGATMYVAAVVVSLLLPDAGLPMIGLVAAIVGAAAGALNGALIVVLKAPPFIITLGTLFVGRGLALRISDTRMVFFPESVLEFGRMTLLGIPAVLYVLAVVLLLAEGTLRYTLFGRRLYAIGSDSEGAERAGISVSKHEFATYVICGMLAAIGAIVSGAQVAAASSGFGYQKEFAVIAAAVLGGTSLFGGRGVAIGAIFGAVLVQMVESGLVMANADPYVYPLIVSTIIIIAVFLDTVRSNLSTKLQSKQIRPDDFAATETSDPNSATPGGAAQ